MITTRDKQVLLDHKVKKIYPIRLLSDEEAMRVFNIHAYNKEKPIKDYEILSKRAVFIASGHPLALRLLGGSLYHEDYEGWISNLKKLKQKYKGMGCMISDDELRDKQISMVMDILRISYDGLQSSHQKLYLDIACFFRWKSIDDAMEISEACNFNPKEGITLLIQKALIEIKDGIFDMHDLIQDMGHYIVKQEHLEHPEERSRVWKHADIRNMLQGNIIKENDKIEAIWFDGYSYEDKCSSRFGRIVSNMKNLRWLRVTMRNVMNDGEPKFLSNELCYIYWNKYPTNPFPTSFQSNKLKVLKLIDSMQEELWSGCKNLPRLEVLELDNMKKLLNTPDFEGLPSLQKLTLSYCEELKEIHESLGSHKSIEYLTVQKCPKLKVFPTLVHMENLKTLEVEDCGLENEDIPSGIGELSNLIELNLSWNDFSRLDFSLSKLTQLKLLNLSYCGKLLELPDLPSSLAILKAEECQSLRTLEDSHRNCEWLCDVSLTRGSMIDDGDKLLQSMLKGNDIEDRSMLLQIEGLEVAKGFRPRLHDGSRFTLQLQENWCKKFCGFLVCVVLPDHFYQRESFRLSMKQVTTIRFAQHNVDWEKSERDTSTLVWYVPFGLLSPTEWWDPTYIGEISFDFEDQHKRCTGIGVRLVAKTNTTHPDHEASSTEDDYTLNSKIEVDSASSLTVSVTSYEKIVA